MTLWTSHPNPLRLQPHQVDVWRISLEVASDSVKQMESHLSTDELKRASRFHFDADRTRFIISHGSLREILSRYLRCQPSELSFSTNDYGKPSLTRSNDFSRLSNTTTEVVTTDKLEFNLSHSGNYAIVAVTHECKIGIDVEHIRKDIEIEDLAARNFSPSEISELMSLPSEQRTSAFFNCWTRKEAYIKSQGLGLSFPLDSFDVSLGEPAALLATRPDPREASRWSLLSLEIDPSHAGAVAVEGQGLDFRFWDWNAIR